MPDSQYIILGRNTESSRSVTLIFKKTQKSYYYPFFFKLFEKSHVYGALCFLPFSFPFCLINSGKSHCSCPEVITGENSVKDATGNDTLARMVASVVGSRVLT